MWASIRRPSRPGRLPNLAAAVALLALVLAAAALGNRLTKGPTDSPVAAATIVPGRSGLKHICDDPTPQWLPADLTQNDRVLVPFTPTVSGVDAHWDSADGQRSLRVVAGGYIDDITEPYDGLRPGPPRTIFGVPATVATTTLLGRTVQVVYWFGSDQPQPCGARAVVGLGLTTDEFQRVLAALAA